MIFFRSEISVRPIKGLILKIFIFFFMQSTLYPLLVFSVTAHVMNTATSIFFIHIRVHHIPQLLLQIQRGLEYQTDICLPTRSQVVYPIRRKFRKSKMTSKMVVKHTNVMRIYSYLLNLINTVEFPMTFIKLYVGSCITNVM